MAQAVTIYRDPDRATGKAMERDWPRGFAMISETRTVTLPPGRSTIRFTGVAEGMVAVSAIVTGLPGGTIEQNRNADLLSPAALVDGTLGNRVRVTRTNPGTGEEISEGAVIRTRADGGLVLQTDRGFEAVRCSGLPERLSFAGVPAGLAAEPVFTIDTHDEAGGTYAVTLSYLAWGFDWEASHVATLHEGRNSEAVRFDLVSWLTLLNDNGQSFADAELLVVAGRLNVVSDYEALVDPPEARPLELTCYPLGSTAAGSPELAPTPAIMLSARRGRAEMMDMMAAPMGAPALAESALVMAAEEDLGDLKLYRVPQPVTIAAQSLKQVAFLNRPSVEGRLLYTAQCDPWSGADSPRAAAIRLETVNDPAHGLGVALPGGKVAVFQRGTMTDLLVADEMIRDYASGQEIELALGHSAQVFTQCNRLTAHASGDRQWSRMRVTLGNANPHPVRLRLYLGEPRQWQIDGLAERISDGQRIAEITIPANGQIVREWRARPVATQ